MSTAAGIGLHVDPSEITHRHHPADDSTAEYGTVKLGRPGHGAYADLFFRGTASVDKMIAELVALKQEMAPPVPATGDGGVLFGLGEYADVVEDGAPAPAVLDDTLYLPCSRHGGGEGAEGTRCPECRAERESAPPVHHGEGITGMQWDSLSSSGSAS